jgi:hypothetical protein
MGIVREHINFERGVDPKKILGIGIFSNKDFANYEEAGLYIIKYLKIILGKKSIPKDIIKTNDETWFLDEYYFKIQEYIDNYLINFSENDREMTMRFIHDYLEDAGYSKGIIKENLKLDFERDLKNPLDTLNIGRIWERKNKEIIIGMKEIANKYNKPLEFLKKGENKIVCISTSIEFNMHIFMHWVNYNFTNKHFEVGLSYHKGVSFSNIGIYKTVEEGLKEVDLYIKKYG